MHWKKQCQRVSVDMGRCLLHMEFVRRVLGPHKPCRHHEHHVVHVEVADTEEQARGTKKAKKKWAPLQVQVMTRHGRSAATMVAKSQTFDFAVLECPEVAFEPLPTCPKVDRFLWIIHCHHATAQGLLRGQHCCSCHLLKLTSNCHGVS